MSRRSVFTINSFGLGLAAPCMAVRSPAADPTARPPSIVAPIDPPGAGADEESDTAFGVIAHPARMGAVASIRMRAICEKRFTRVPPFREPCMGPRFDSRAAAVRQLCTSNARSGHVRDMVQYPAIAGHVWFAPRPRDATWGMSACQNVRQSPPPRHGGGTRG